MLVGVCILVYACIYNLKENCGTFEPDSFSRFVTCRLWWRDFRSIIFGQTDRANFSFTQINCL